MRGCKCLFVPFLSLTITKAICNFCMYCLIVSWLNVICSYIRISLSLAQNFIPFSSLFITLCSYVSERKVLIKVFLPREVKCVVSNNAIGYQSSYT